MEFDEWQKKVLETKGNICLRSGRQVGKSTIIAAKAGRFALDNPDKTILIVAAVERQANLLFDKTLGFIHDTDKNAIKKGKDKPTRHIIKLKNGSVIYCLPTGLSGYGIRGYTIDLLIADEAAFIPQAVWTAVTPMLAATHGDIWLLSTPFGRKGYFYDCFSSPNFNPFHVRSDECPRISKEFLEAERRRMTKVQYAQEYLGEFVEEASQFFPDELIQRIAVIGENSISSNRTPLFHSDSFLGVDVARLGGDETVLVSLHLLKNKTLEMFGMDISEKTYLTETIERIKINHKQNQYKRIYIDDGGVGSGVFDVLLQDEQTKRQVVAINNSSRGLDKNETRRKKILKEDLYNNLLWLMQNNAIKLFDNDELKLSLKSIQYEYTDKGDLKIYGKYSHICEAIIRAAWCVKDKSIPLNIWVRF